MYIIFKQTNMRIAKFDDAKTLFAFSSHKKKILLPLGRNARLDPHLHQC